MTTRPYRLRKRREQQDATRRRIVEATMALHEEIGPAATTISAIAERAGVQRLTVYRHFPDERALIGACSAHWSAAHPTPDPAAWAHLRDPRRRLEAALGALYDYYRGGEAMLTRVLRDAETDGAVADAVAPLRRYLGELADDLGRGWHTPARARRVLRAAVGHAVAFETWRSLAAEGLSDTEAARIMAGMAGGAMRG
jgi:AcrR family transcriptional regulator